MKIWIVFDCEPHEQSLIVGVYDSRVEADTRAEEMNAAIPMWDRNKCEVREFTVGEPLPGRNERKPEGSLYDFSDRRTYE